MHYMTKSMCTHDHHAHTWAFTKLLITRTGTVFTLGFKMRLGRSRHKWTPEKHCHLRMPFMRLWGVLLITWAQTLLLPVSLPLEGQTSPCMVMLKISHQQHNFITSLYSYHLHPCTALQFFLPRHAVTKTTTVSCVNNAYPYYILVGDAPGLVSVCTTKGTWWNVSQTTSGSGLNKCALGVIYTCV